MSSPIITVENLSKRYMIHHQLNRGEGFRHVLQEKLTAPFRALLSRKEEGRGKRLMARGAPEEGRGKRAEGGRGTEEFWALKNVSFEVKQGEVVGIIGRNGAGKSTLLKILSRITEPTEGCVRLRGRVASLLEVGTGFHPELTGRENIFLNGSILGMSKAEIRKKFDEIVAFSEVEKFLDTPVKRYSSGMYVRLAFAVAAHLEPEILIVDEVLAVGDAEFQKKCLGKMQDVAKSQGRTILFVSHHLGAVEALCQNGLLMQKGEVKFRGKVQDALSQYLAGFERRDNQDLESETNRSGNGKVRLRQVKLLADGVSGQQVASGTDACLEFAYANPQNIASARLCFTIYAENGTALTHINNSLAARRLALAPGSGVISCRLSRLPLNLGRYRIAAAMLDEGGETYDNVASALWFDVVGSRFFSSGSLPDPRNSPVLVDHDWF